MISWLKFWISKTKFIGNGLRKNVERRVAFRLSQINDEEELDEPRIATDL